MLSNLKLVRLKKGFKSKEVAKKLKVSPSYISKLENGSAIVTNEILIKLARLYEVPPKDLIYPGRPPAFRYRLKRLRFAVLVAFA